VRQFSHFRILAFPRISHFRAFCIHRAFWRFRASRIFAHFAYTARFGVSAHLAFSRILHTLHVSHFHAFRIYRTFRILASFAHFAFQIPRVFAHLMNYAHLAILHSSHSHTHISRRFRILAHFAYFTLSHFSHFDMRYRTPPWDPSHSVRMSCPHPPWSIGAYLTWFHSHYITYVFAFTFMFIYLIMCLYYITLVCLALLTRLQGLGTRLAC
jgi:hypothetical protein